MIVVPVGIPVPEIDMPGCRSLVEPRPVIVAVAFVVVPDLTIELPPKVKLKPVLLFPTV